MFGIEGLVADSQWQHWLEQAAKRHAQVRLVMRDAQSAATDLNGIQAALLHVDAASGALVKRYAASGIPVVLLATRSTNQARTYEFIQAGASYVCTIEPNAVSVQGALERALSLVHKQSDSAGSPDVGAPLSCRALPVKQPRRSIPPIVAIGASAGGPKALTQVLMGLPAGLHAAVVMVVHVEPGQDAGLRDFLAAGCKLPIDSATGTTILRPGRVVLGAAGQHLELDAAGQLTLHPPQAGDLFCPSIDRLFTSLAQLPAGGVAALMTGMGTDGARGLLALRQAGWPTLAQDAASSAVYGMPREAAQLGAASVLVPLLEIAPMLLAKLYRMFPPVPQIGPSFAKTRPSIFCPDTKL